MAKIFCLKFADNGSLKEINEAYGSRYLELVKEIFQDYYECFSEDYFVEKWNDFVFSIPALNCVYVLRDLD